MWGVTFHSYTKGNGYMDKAGCHRDMNLYKLTKEDPYAHMRQPGEADDLAQKLRNAGKFGHDRHGNKTTKIWTSKQYLSFVKYLCTIFNDGKLPKPLLSAFSDGDTTEIFNLYQRGTGITLQEVAENKNKISELICNEEIYVNDFKRHLWAFDLSLTNDYRVWTSDEHVKTSEELTNTINKMTKHFVKEWERLLAEASIVYQSIQNRGIYIGYQHINPNYGFTLTGRSKTTGFNAHNTDEDIRLRPDDNDVFVHFDWLSADIRACSLLAQDEEMEETFKTSNPYAVIAEKLGDQDRDTIKIAMLESIYSLNTDSPIVAYYNKFKRWMAETIERMDVNGYTETILGRRFYLDQMPDQDRARRTAFNAAIQGTVAHAMQNTLVKLNSIMPGSIVTEIYDSIVISCSKQSIKDVINSSIEIMLHPFADLLDYNPIFPVRVSIGKQWRRWKQYKEYRE